MWPTCMASCDARCLSMWVRAAMASASSMVARSSPTTRAPSWGWAMSTVRWSAAPASKPPILSPSSRPAVLDPDGRTGLVPSRLGHPPRMGDGRNAMTRSAFSLALAAVLLQAPASWATQLDKESCTKLKSEQVQLEKDGARSSLGKGPDWAKANLAPEKIEHVRRLIEVDEQLLFRCGGRPLVVLPSDPDAVPGEGAAERPEKAPLDKDKGPADGKKAPVPLPKAIAPAPKVTPAPKATAPEPKATAPKATAAPPKEAAKDARPPAPLPRANAPAGAASTLAKEAQPAGSAPAASPPGPPPTKEDPSQATPAATMAAPPAPPATEAADEKKAAALKAAKAKAKKKPEDAYRPPAPDWSSNPFADQMAPPAKQ